MGENIKVTEQHSPAAALREQIRHTESDITQTVHSLEERLSPRYLRQRGARNAKRLAWEGTAKFLDLAQRTSVQASLLGGMLGGSALLMLFSNKTARNKIGLKKTAAPQFAKTGSAKKAGPAAKAAGTGAVWFLTRKSNEKKPGVSGIVLAATAAKAFLTGARSSAKSGTTRPGRKVAWRGLATAIGAALGSYWYSHRERRV